MRKLLLSTAIASATLVASNAIAQTTISGQLDIAFKSFSDDRTANKVNSSRGFGKEAQINIQNKGKLNNGMDYAAGFSLEDDGNQAGSNFNENTYINFISGNTTLHFGQDHIQNATRTLGNFQGLIAEDLNNMVTDGAANAAVSTDIFTDSVGGDVAQSFGVGLVQSIPGIGNLSALYVPSISGNGALGHGGDDQGSDATAESAYEIGFVGGFGVKGLSTHAFYAKGEKLDTAAATSVDPKGHNIGISYNMGATTVGYTHKKDRLTANTAAAGERKQDEFAISYALSPNLTLAANYTKAEMDGTATPADAKAKSISLGYNLGPIALVAQAAQLEDYTGVSGVDADVLYFRASTKF
jgi:hypothetical protein